MWLLIIFIYFSLLALKGNVAESNYFVNKQRSGFKENSKAIFFKSSF